MTQYQYVGPVTAFTLTTGSTTIILVPDQVISLDENNTYVARLVECGHLIIPTEGEG